MDTQVHSENDRSSPGVNLMVMRARPVVIVARKWLGREALAHVVGRAQLEVVACVATLRELDRKSISNELLIVIIGSAPDAESTLLDVRNHREQHPSDRIVVLSDS